MPASLVVLAAGLARRYGGCKPLAPIGPGGEAVIDLLVSDAVSAGFGRIVLVLHPETGPSIRYHVQQCWPRGVEVAFAQQRLPLGTVHAVLAAHDELDDGQPFAVCNADDIYGEAPMRLLADHLGDGAFGHALVGYRLRDTVATADPVTRGICEVGADGALRSLTERRQVTRLGDGSEFAAKDGLEPSLLSGDVPASVNLWGFLPGIWATFRSAMDDSGLDEERLLAEVAAGAEPPKAEVLLPEVVATMVAAGRGRPVTVLTTDARVIGVTHAADLPVVSAELARQVAFGIRPSGLFDDCIIKPTLMRL